MASKEQNIYGSDGRIHVIAYARVWDDDLEQDPQAQLGLIRQWAVQNNAVIEKEFWERSDGTDPKTDVMLKMLGYVKTFEDIVYVVVVEPGRLCRNYDCISDLSDFPIYGCELLALVYPTRNKHPSDNRCLFAISVINSEKEYQLYKRFGVRTVLGQMTFADYLSYHLDTRKTKDTGIIYQEQKKYAVAYARTPSPDMGRELGSQIETIRKWTENKGDYVILRVFRDATTDYNESHGIDMAIGYIERMKREGGMFISDFLVADEDVLSSDPQERDRYINALNTMGLTVRAVIEQD